MFKTRKYYEPARDVREIKKLLPFTVNAIGDKNDLAQWKLAQAAKEESWQLKRASQVESVKTRLIANEIFDASGLGLSEASKRYKALGDKSKSFIAVPGKVYHYYQKPSLFQKAVTKCLEWFLQFNF